MVLTYPTYDACHGKCDTVTVHVVIAHTINTQTHRVVRRISWQVCDTVTVHAKIEARREHT
jgi:hypothetical protein